VTATRPNGQSELAARPRVGRVPEPPEDSTENARLRAELEALRAEYERAADSENRLRLELARVEGESEDRAVRLMLAEERIAGRDGGQPRP
jgi:hypothetical protein